MNNSKFNQGLSAAPESYVAEPQQMTLFPEEKPGRDLEQMKIRTLLKAFYKTADDNVAVDQAG